MGHSIKLEDRDRRILLIKGIHVEDCLDLDHQLQKLRNPNSPNLIQGLTQEHKFMRATSHAPSNHNIASPFLSNEPYDSNHDFLFRMMSPTTRHSTGSHPIHTRHYLSVQWSL
jgi:hypothetical protein